MLITVLLSLSPAEEVLANFWLIPFKEVAAELDILLKPLLRPVLNLVAKLVTAEVILPPKLLLILSATVLALELTELKAAETALVILDEKLTTALVALVNADFMG
ncbi:Uncharacterised protein [Streptococcus equi subsp. equi]|nr:Uncharacterised protein [Streptococcus equi subsp. equi]CRS58653.1 Uncharacterised protein [Streptococcus equi subsp. equi]CRS58710.1 Uncharacterised protein [Streptococcus equi subsp. equi]CRS92879.1 Uncharacterised protein [Streptococcus equi subsp. equi]CRT72965.1 Uncharacterised protein [Streptococcus equi subsp. equi]